jgi:GNAT superfamily N-acetyltransferase
MLYLLRHEAEHCLPIGLVAQAIENPRRWDGPLTFATVERDGVPVAAAIRTPPHEPVLSRIADLDAIPHLVELFAGQADVSGVLAPIEAGEAFAREWTLTTGQTAEIAMSERIYALERVRPVRGVPGALRRATAADRPRLIEWNEAFVKDGFGELATPGMAERAVDARLHGEQSGFAFWEVGGPVCLVGYTGPTPDGIRIGPVYTPPEHRRKGYASAATATLSQMLLDEGRRFCVLFTDLANPTSNHIYQAIGYEPVADVVVYRFTR